MAPPSPTTPPRPKRRWLAFSLRALLAFALLACLVAAYFGNLWRHVQKRRATLDQLHARGYYHQYNFNPELDEQKQPPGPWIGRVLIGDDAYARIESIHSTQRKTNSVDDLKLLADLPEARIVSLRGDWVTDEAVGHLAKVRGLEGLGFYETSITPDGFARLAKIRNLKSFGLMGNNINDDTFAHFHELPHLERLNLQVFELTPAGLAHLGKIASLENLFVANVKGIDAAGLQHLASLGKLEELAMYGVSLDEAAVAQISRIKSLKSVRFTKCSMNDEAARKLAGLSDLESLSLQDMPVGDGCVEAILSLRQLDHVSFSNSQLTDEGFLRLVALPKLQQIAIDSNARTPGGGTLLVTPAAGQEFARQRPDCNVIAGSFSNIVRKYIPRRERNR